MYEGLNRKFSKEMGRFGEKAKSPEEKAKEEAEEIENKYFEYEKKIDEYRDKCKDELYQTFLIHFEWRKYVIRCNIR